MKRLKIKKSLPRISYIVNDIIFYTFYMPFTYMVKRSFTCTDGIKDSTIYVRCYRMSDDLGKAEIFLETAVKSSKRDETFKERRRVQAPELI